jgi:Cys-rich protein (TIGR04453 family)
MVRIVLDGNLCQSCLVRFAVVVLAVTALTGTAGGCKETTECEKACDRVAACQKQANEGDPILGDKKAARDPECLAKCENHPEEFEKCEGKKRTCDELRACRGSFR